MEPAAYASFPGPWDNPAVHRPYQADSIVEKVFNKLELQEILGLPLSDTLPVVASDDPVPPPAQTVCLAQIRTAEELSMVLAGCDILVTKIPELQNLARRYGTCPVENAQELAEALQFYEDPDAWQAIARRLMQTADG